MAIISIDIQNGFMLRRGWRGKWLTLYHHRYNGHQEVTERSHDHPWHYVASLVLCGRVVEIREGKRVERGAFSFDFWTGKSKHKIVEVKPGTRTLFFGFKRHRDPATTRNASLNSDGYLYHYTEIRDVPLSEFAKE